MSKPLIGLILGAVLGVIDGLTAWFTPDARSELGSIVVGSTIKGIIAGIAIGFGAAPERMRQHTAVISPSANSSPPRRMR